MIGDISLQIEFPLNMYAHVNTMWGNSSHHLRKLQNCSSPEKILLTDRRAPVFFLLGTLTRILIATMNLLNGPCSEITFISHIYPL